MSDSQQPYTPQSVPSSPPVTPPPGYGSEPSPYGPPGAYPPSNQFPPTPPARPGNGLGIAALIVGIFAFIGAFIPFVNYVSGFLAVVGIILGIIAITRKNKPKKAGVAGLIVSAVALILSIVLAFAYTAGFVAAVDEALPQSSIQETDDAAPAEEADEAETEASAEVGTRENPAPIGTTVEITTAGAPTYEVTLGAPTLDATDVILAENQFTEAPPEGFQYALLPVTVTYTGTETGTPWIDLQITYVSAAGTTHTQSDALAVAPSPTFMEINELYPDASGTGNIVIAIPTADAAAGSWTVEPLFLGDTFFFAAE
ncbi:hypothetical protein IWX78_000638 [Mycetocola sp. CAN_C7]|uniref:DUF308 domain-containing protein n=1 Tax=Mycetocola sp. CAN_C7 TaxID=2787724 RepID=UPI0018C8E7E2